jgi:hypothetical protein
MQRQAQREAAAINRGRERETRETPPRE